MLTDRLAKLEAQGIATKQRDPDDARRFVYRLTEKGIDLAPILVELVLWSAKYEETEAPDDVVRNMRADRQRFIAQVKAAQRVN